MAQSTAHRTALLATALFFGCATHVDGSGEQPVEFGPIHAGQRASFAVYNDQGHLLSNPLDHLKTFVKSSELDVTDIFVLVHGWNYTLAEGLARYNRYIDAFDAALPSPSEEFNPYVMFVAWPSASRPLSTTAHSLLPHQIADGLDRILRPTDSVLFHLPSAWAQSQSARQVALGLTRPHRFADQVMTRPDRFSMHRDDRRGSREFPLFLILRRLIELRTGGYLGKDTRIHCIGHSYGARLITMATVEAIASWYERVFWDDPAGFESDPGAPIESLILFNPAFTPPEVGYVRGTQHLYQGVVERDDQVAWSFDKIPRKGLVYSNWDWANGRAFDLSQLLLDRVALEDLSPVEDPVVTLGATTTVLGASWDWGGDLIMKTVGGIYFLAASIAASPIQWVSNKLVQSPGEFGHHIAGAGLLDATTSAWIRVPVNALHYFMPIDQVLWPGGASDGGGILRMHSPGLGRSGLVRYARGRPRWVPTGFFGGRRLLAGFDAFVDDETEIDAEHFVGFAVDSPGHAMTIDPAKFYSFDGSMVLGGHNALLDAEPEPTPFGERSPSEVVFGFVRRFTSRKTAVGQGAAF